MKSSTYRTIAVLLVGCAALSSFGSAQDAPTGNNDDLLMKVKQQHLDSYWLENRMWEQYGYRPQIKTKAEDFANMPNYFSGSTSYSYGPTVAPVYGDPLSKPKIQLSKYGTWH